MSTTDEPSNLTNPPRPASPTFDHDRMFAVLMDGMSKGPAAYRTAMANYLTTFLDLEALLDRVLAEWFVPRSPTRSRQFQTVLMAEVDVTGKVKVLRRLLKEQPGPHQAHVARILNKIDKSATRRNQVAHRVPSFNEDDGGATFVLGDPARDAPLSMADLRGWRKDVTSVIEELRDLVAPVLEARLNS